MSSVAIAPNQSRPREMRAGHRLDIQGLRAVAVIVVVIFHAGLPLPGGFVGVDVFFVISGFVITSMLHREIERHGRIRFRAFYVRRFKRLTPALALTVLVTILVSSLLLSPLGPQQDAAHTGIGAIFLSANIVIAQTTGGYFDAPAEANPLLHTWSLSLEEQFYLIFPVIVAVGYGLRAKWRIARLPMVIVALVALLSFSLALVDSRGAMPSLVPDFLIGYYGLPTRAWEFAAGALLALVLGSRANVPRFAAFASAAMGSMLLIASVLLISGTTPFPGIATLLPVTATVLLLLAGSGGPNILSGALSGPLLTKLGDWSYSIYLWHWPLIVFARMLWDHPIALALAALVSILPAYASYRWVEQPIRAMQVTSSAHLGRILAVTLVPPVTLAASLSLVASQGYWSSTVRMYQAFHIDRISGCDSTEAAKESSWLACTWNSSAPGAPIYLVGDSNAGHFAEAIVGAGEVLDRPVAVMTRSTCPFVGGFLERADLGRRGNERCRAHNIETMQRLMNSRPGTVVIAATDRYWYESEFSFGVDEPSASAETPAKLLAFETSLPSTVGILKGAGHQVMLVQTIPRWSGNHQWERRRCSMLDIITTPTGCGAVMKLEVAVQRQAETRRVIDAVADKNGATVFDPGPFLCPASMCSVQTDGFVRMRDDRHISVAQSTALIPAFVRALSS